MIIVESGTLESMCAMLVSVPFLALILSCLFIATVPGVYDYSPTRRKDRVWVAKVVGFEEEASEYGRDGESLTIGKMDQG